MEALGIGTTGPQQPGAGPSGGPGGAGGASLVSPAGSCLSLSLAPSTDQLTPSVSAGKSLRRLADSELSLLKS